jgi:hypothetical protein
MPIIAINAAMTIRPVNRPCPPAGGVFVVNVIVTGRVRGRGGSYDISIYDQDLIGIFDDLLDANVANGVLAGPGGAVRNFRRQHTFFLKCDNNCNVIGRLGTSGESVAEIYAYADGGGGVTNMTAIQKVSCVPPDEEAEASGSARRRGKSRGGKRKT